MVKRRAKREEQEGKGTDIHAVNCDETSKVIEIPLTCGVSDSRRKGGPRPAGLFSALYLATLEQAARRLGQPVTPHSRRRIETLHASAQLSRGVASATRSA